MGEPVHGLMTNVVMPSVALGYDGSLSRHMQYMQMQKGDRDEKLLRG